MNSKEVWAAPPADVVERVRCLRVILDEIERVRATSPFPAGSGEPVAVAIEQVAYGLELAARAIMK